MADITQLLSQFLYARLAQLGSTGGSASGVLGGSLSTTSYTTVGTAEETAYSFSLPASTLEINGRALRIVAWGTTAANGNNKQMKLTFGGTTLSDSGTLTVSGQNWRFESVLVRTSPTAQVANTMRGVGAFGTGSGNSNATPAETLSGAVTIALKLTTSTAATDATFTGAYVELLN